MLGEVKNQQLGEVAGSEPLNKPSARGRTLKPGSVAATTVSGRWPMCPRTPLTA
jgi:hypothetical protein